MTQLQHIANCHHCKTPIKCSRLTRHWIHVSSLQVKCSRPAVANKAKPEEETPIETVASPAVEHSHPVKVAAKIKR